MKQNTENLVKAFGYLTLNEAQLLMDIADKMPAGSIVANVGAGVGTSALAVVEQRNDLAQTLYTIDHRDDDNPFGGLLNERHAFENAGMIDLLPNQILGDSSDVGRSWQHGKIDFLIIDADHTAEGLTNDIDAYVSHLSDAGYIAFHDYDKDKWQDVFDVVNKHFVNNEDFELVKTVDTMIVFTRKQKVRNVKSAQPDITYDSTDSANNNDTANYEVEELKQDIEKTKAATGISRRKKTEGQ